MAMLTKINLQYTPDKKINEDWTRVDILPQLLLRVVVGLATDRASIGQQPDSRNKYIHSVILYPLYSGGQSVSEEGTEQLIILVLRGFHMNYELF